jgi:quercetin dioxygenase-like cupin family protein
MNDRFNRGFAEHGVEVVHNYAKETRIPAGLTLGQHVHPFDHESHLKSGVVLLTVDGAPRRYEAPAWLTIKAGTSHQITAVTDAVWLCVWPMDVGDEHALDETITAGAPLRMEAA